MFGIRARSVARTVVAVSLLWFTERGSAQELPPIGCVEALREARIEEAAAQLAAARQRIEASVESPGCELPALAELLRLLHAGSYPETAALALRQRLAGRLQDPAVSLPGGTLSYLASLRTSAEQDEELRSALERRLAAIDARGLKPSLTDLVELLTVATDLQERLGHLPAARESVGRLLALEGVDRWRWRALGLDQRLERWEEVALRLEEMLAAPLAPVHLRRQYVTTLARLGRYEQMLLEIDRLPTPGSAEAEGPEPLVGFLVEIGWVLRDAGRDTEAEAIFRRALALDEKAEAARVVLLHLYGSGEERAAHAAVVELRREQEDDPQRLYEEGSQLVATSDFATAFDLLARAAPALGGTVYEEAAWYNFGLAAYKLERWPEAARAFQHAAEINPERPETQFQLGVALYRAGRCGEALAPLARALELKPEKPEGHYFLAGCYETLGDSAAAARELDLYRKMKPNG